MELKIWLDLTSSRPGTAQCTIPALNVLPWVMGQYLTRKIFFFQLIAALKKSCFFSVFDQLIYCALYAIYILYIYLYEAPCRSNFLLKQDLAWQLATKLRISTIYLPPDRDTGPK